MMKRERIMKGEKRKKKVEIKKSETEKKMKIKKENPELVHERKRGEESDTS